MTTQHKLGNLNESSISTYARSHRVEEVTIGMSLLCSLPGDVVERALLDKNRETLLILCKTLDFSWDTTMALLFLGAKDHRITANDLRSLESDYGRLNIETSSAIVVPRVDEFGEVSEVAVFVRRSRNPFEPRHLDEAIAWTAAQERPTAATAETWGAA